MKRIAAGALRGARATVVALMLSVSAAPAKPRIVILATGGTIVGAQACIAEVGYKSLSFLVDDLITAVTQIQGLADLSGEERSKIG